jgi:homoprotocatechuate degradation regulator HpaR
VEIRSLTCEYVNANRDTTFRNRNLPLLLLRTRERIVARFRPLLHAHGITEQQWRVVRLLTESGPLEPREIGALCNVSSPSLTGVLARMDADGLVRRERFASDQRRVRVSLTARARRLAAEMAPAIDETYGELRALIGEPLYARLCQTMDDVLERLEPTGDDDE